MNTFDGFAKSVERGKRAGVPGCGAISMGMTSLWKAARRLKNLNTPRVGHDGPFMAITTRIGCKVNCAYCPQDVFVKKFSSRDKTFVMSLDTFRECIDKMPTKVAVHFAGMCEPWLNAECTAMALYANERGHQQRVYTTLVGMEIDDIQRMEEIPFLLFMVHLPDEAGNTNVKVDDHYLEVLGALCKSSLPNIRFVVQQGKCPQAVAEVVGEYRIKLLNPMDRAGNIQVEEEGAPKRVPGRIRCNFSTGNNLDHNILLPNGDVILCCMDYGMRHVLGNLKTGSYESLFQGEEYQMLVKSLDDESVDTLCRFCTNTRKADS